MVHQSTAPPPTTTIFLYIFRYFFLLAKKLNDELTNAGIHDAIFIKLFYVFIFIEKKDGGT